MICADEHDLTVVMAPASAADEPVGLICSRCGRRWPVGPALPMLYDQEAEPPFNGEPADAP